MGKWLATGNQPSLQYYLEIEGRRGEGHNVPEIFDLLTEPGYSEVEDIRTKLVMWALLLKDVAIFLAQQGRRADVYDGLGKVFSNYDEQEGELNFYPDEPVILDAWTEETTLASLININYISLYEKNNSIEGYEALTAEKLEEAYSADYKPPLRRT